MGRSFKYLLNPVPLLHSGEFVLLPQVRKLDYICDVSIFCDPHSPGREPWRKTLAPNVEIIYSAEKPGHNRLVPSLEWPFFKYGMLGKITHAEEIEHGVFILDLHGQAPVEIFSYAEATAESIFPIVQTAAILPDLEPEDDTVTQDLFEKLISLIQKFCRFREKVLGEPPDTNKELLEKFEIFASKGELVEAKFAFRQVLSSNSDGIITVNDLQKFFSFKTLEEELRSYIAILSTLTRSQSQILTA